MGVVKDYRGKNVNLSDYKGKVLPVVNVASKCGFTDSNYTQLSELHDKYKEKDRLFRSMPYKDLRSVGLFYEVLYGGHLAGFEILAFPCNQFLSQEPGSSKEVQEFACTKYNVGFPVFKKVNVNGQDTAPLYRFLKASKGGFLGSRIKWNFTKFLVNKDSQCIGRYATMTQPFAIEPDIKRELGMA